MLGSDDPDIVESNALAEDANKEEQVWPVLWTRGLVPLERLPEMPAL